MKKMMHLSTIHCLDIGCHCCSSGWNTSVIGSVLHRTSIDTIVATLHLYKTDALQRTNGSIASGWRACHLCNWERAGSKNKKSRENRESSWSGWSVTVTVIQRGPSYLTLDHPFTYSTWLLLKEKSVNPLVVTSLPSSNVQHAWNLRLKALSFVRRNASRATG